MSAALVWAIPLTLLLAGCASAAAPLSDEKGAGGGEVPGGGYTPRRSDRKAGVATTKNVAIWDRMISFRPT